METKANSVLVIDGDSASRNFLAAMLSKNGYTVLSTSLGREGLISAWRDQPDIIILDPVLPDLTGLELITRLRQDRRTSKVMLIALCSREDSQEMSTLLNAGCNEYLVKSSQTLQKLLDLLPHVENAEKPEPKKQGRLIVFLSAKGGTGTSSLCANIAMCAASEKEDRKVAVIDLVLPIGSIAHIVGYEDPLNLVTVAMQTPDQLTPEFFKDNLPAIPGWYFYLLAGSPDPESANRLSGDRVGEILTAILESYDFVFVDLGRSLSRISIPIILKADIIALILSTDMATAELTMTVWDYLKTQGVDSQRIYAIQNRAVGLEGLMKSELEKMIGLSIGVTMPYIGDNLTVANNRHEPVVTRFQDGSITFMLKQVASLMVEVDKHRTRR
jgi:MinD-like ATPase involved in chromosome partitioning or flagellar assembly/ActR/RegA family two-component response regulator